MSYIKTHVTKCSHLHLIPFHFYNFLPSFRLPCRQGHSCLGAGQDDVRLLGSGDWLQLPGCHGFGPARSWETGKCLLTVRTFVAFGANAEVAIAAAAAAAAVAMVTRVAGAGIHNKLKETWGQLFPRKKEKRCHHWEISSVPQSCCSSGNAVSGELGCGVRTIHPLCCPGVASQGHPNIDLSTGNRCPARIFTQWRTVSRTQGPKQCWFRNTLFRETC